MTRRALALVALLAVVTPAASARAEEAIDDPTERAAEHYRRGSELYGAGEYDRAIEEFLAAWALAPEPLLLFNVAQAYLAKGDRRMAYEYYRKYVDADPQGQAAEIARARIAELAPEFAEPPPPPPDPPPPREPSRGSRALRIAGVTLAAAGVVGLAVGGWYGWVVEDREQQVEDMLADNVWDPTVDPLLAEGERAEDRMVLFVAAGSAAVLTGAAMYLLGRPDDPPRAASILFDGSSASLFVHGRF